MRLACRVSYDVMAKQGEIDYLRSIGDAGRRFTINKPFSDPNCAGHLLELGAILTLLPPPPARLLDVGCGTGWTSRLFARRGYDVVGVDIAPDMIEHARRGGVLDNLRFLVADYEEMHFADVFDAVVFYDSLHHALDETQALRMVHRVLKPAGICITAEPGRGHADTAASVEARHKYQVTEKDMPPATVMDAARRAGFRHFRVYPHGFDVGNLVYGYSGGRLRALMSQWDWLRRLRSWTLLGRLFVRPAGRGGIVVMRKG